jgi:5-deoxy-glucuronate isomerase
MFDYLHFNQNGVATLSQINGINSDMLMDVRIHKLKSGQSLAIFESDKETALLLLCGRLRLDYAGKTAEISRADLFSDLPSCLHFASGLCVTATALTDAEILVQQTTNDKYFQEKLYLPEDAEVFVSAKDNWEGTARRNVVTIFDHDIAPYSNMVLGEIFVPQGRWFSYIPHHHPQPEIYYYRLPRPEGFGACFIGGAAYTITDNSCGCFSGGQTHPQVTAPGYPMYCCWMIRHFDNDPWLKTRTDDERFTWLLNS